MRLSCSLAHWDTVWPGLWLKGSVPEPKPPLTKLAFLNPPTSHLQVFDFTFSPEEMKQLDALNKNLRFIVPMLTVSVCHTEESGNVSSGTGFWPKSALNLAGQRSGRMLLAGLLSWTQWALYSLLSLWK